MEPIVQLTTALSEWFPSSTTVDPDGVDQPAIAGVGGVILTVPDEGSLLARDGGTLANADGLRRERVPATQATHAEEIV